MTSPALSHTVPVQETGVGSHTEYTVEREDAIQAEQLFRQAATNLCNVNAWRELAAGGASFGLTDATGTHVSGTAREGLLIRISIPNAPAASSGHGSEWVRIEKIIASENEHAKMLSMRVRPVKSPLSGDDAVAHFFTDDATSTFVVENEDRLVRASVFGRNEKPNTSKGSIKDRLRNLVMGLAAMIGFNKPQWGKLVKGLLTRTAA